MDLISIIIPIYNVLEYLERCINSVISQTYTELEVILVDDGSTDGSGQICNKYEKKDKRIKVIHKKNGGLSDARNAGLDIMNGSYVFFVDSDDYLKENCIEVLKKALDESNADIAVGGYYMRFENGYCETVGADNKILLFDTYDAVRDLLNMDHIKQNAWGKLFNKNLFEIIRFPDGKLYEDLAVIFNIILAADKTVYVGSALYNYEIRVNSIMQSPFSAKQFVEVSIADAAMDLVEDKYPDLCDLTAGRRIYSYCKTLHRILNSTNKNDYKIMQDEAISKIKRYASKALKSNRTSRALKIKIISIYAGRNVFQLVQNLSDKVKQKKAGQKYIV